MLLRQIFDPQLAQYAYLIGCEKTGQALIVDPQRDIDRYQKLAAENSLQIIAVAETHIHADFVSGAQEFSVDPAIAIYLSSEGAPDWLYQWPHDRPHTHFLKDGDHFMVGNIHLEAILTAGHTPEHLSFLITDLGSAADIPLALLSGDFLFVGDVGRPDLLESAAGIKATKEIGAETLLSSLKKCLNRLEDYVQIWPAHGAGSSCGKSLGAIPMTTLGYERRCNKALKLALDDGEMFKKEILSGQPDPPLYFKRMKMVNCHGIAITKGIPQVSKLQPKEFEASAAKSSFIILDTRRSAEDYSQAHMPGSIYAPLHTPFFSTAVGSYIDAESNILLLVDHQADIETAVRQLYRIGFDKIAGWLSAQEADEAGLLQAHLPLINFSDFQLDEALKEGLILDVRTIAEYQAGHLEQALSIPYTRLKERLHEIPKQKKLFVHCASGRRALLATSFLRAENIEAVHLNGSLPQALLTK